MNLTSLNMLTGDLSGLAPSEQSATADQAQHFAELVERAKKGTTAEEIREAAEQLVSATFIKPILNQIRESNDAAPPFAPTQGEKQFGALMDQRIADEIVKSSRLPIVDRLTRDFAARAGVQLKQESAIGQNLEVSA